MKIPTLLALAMLVTAITLGIILYSLNKHQTTQTAEPANITLVNLTDQSATIIWQTQTPDTGLVSFGESSSLGNSQNDFRDQNPTPHLNHLVTLNNLSPNTEYFYKVRSGTKFFPDNVISFKTPNSPSDDAVNAAKQNKPVTGIVVDPSLIPVDEALVTLTVAGGANLATLTSESGNFIIPTIALRRADLSDLLEINPPISAKLFIKKNNLKSQISLNLPLPDTPLPKIILGQDADFTKLASPSAKAAPNFDLNGDGKINSLDLSLLLDNFGKNVNDKTAKFNLNGDGKIDQMDVDLLRAAIK